jgi:sugar-phosphatase
MQCKGFLFDLDGTLLDSLPIAEKIWFQWAIEHKCDPADVLAYIHGRQAIASLRRFLPEYSEELIQKELTQLDKVECENTENITALPGARELLTYLDCNSIPWAIVTSGTPSLAKARHAAAKLPHPHVFITADQITHSKPHPEPFLLGARALGLSSADCVVFEDTDVGIESGLSAGCIVIAMAHNAGEHDKYAFVNSIANFNSIIFTSIEDGYINFKINIE